MPTVADFLVKRVTEYGWFSVGNLYFDNCYAVNPFDSGGRICMSQSAELIIIISNYDAVNSGALMDYLVHDQRNAGYMQTATLVGFDHLQHFDVNLFNLTQVYPPVCEEFVLPTIPTPDIINAIAVDPATGLAEGYSVGRRLDKKEMAVFDMHPDLEFSKAFGARIPDLQRFYKNQQQFAEAMNKFLGLSDCI